MVYDATVMRSGPGGFLPRFFLNGWFSGGVSRVKKRICTGIGIFIVMMGFSLSAGAGDRPTVFVSILPQKYFVEKVAGDFLSIQVMVPKGASPHTYEPKPRQMTLLTGAKVYFSMGVPFEAAWINKFKGINPHLLFAATDAGIEKMVMANHHSLDADHHGDDAHNHDGVKDPHVWTSPVLVKIMAENIYNTLVDIWPDHKESFYANFEGFLNDLEKLDQDLGVLFSSHVKNKSFMVFHPSWGYFAKTYGLTQIPIEMEGKEPKPAQLTRIITRAKTLGIGTVFVQPQFSAKSARVIADAIGGKVVEADPLAYDWEANLRQQAEAFRWELE
jgi:zinc transport system substrate-binding protein